MRRVRIYVLYILYLAWLCHNTESLHRSSLIPRLHVTPSVVALNPHDSPNSIIDEGVTPDRIQQFDYSVLSLVASELQANLVPSKVENLVMEDKFNVALQVKTASGKIVWINFSWHPQTCRICLQPSPVITEETFSFEDILKSLLKNLVMTDVDIPFLFERVVRLSFAENLHEDPKLSLYVEILGSRSNVILVSCLDNSIQAAAYQTSSSSKRVIQICSEYTRPIIKDGRKSPAVFVESPEIFNEDMFLQLLETCKPQEGEQSATIERALLSRFLGLSSSIVHKIITRSGLAPVTTINELRRSGGSELFREFLAWINTVSTTKGGSSTSSIHLTYLAGARGSGDKIVSGFELDFNNQTLIRDENSDKMVVNDLIREYYFETERNIFFNRIKTSCHRLLSSRQDRVDNLRSIFCESASTVTSEKSDVLFHKADLITSFMHTWSDGDSSLVCYDFDTGKEIEVSIPAEKSPASYAESLYKKSRKLKRSREISDILLTKLDAFQLYLDEVASSLMMIDQYRCYEDILALKEIEIELDDMHSELCSMYIIPDTVTSAQNDDEFEHLLLQKRTRGASKIRKKASKKCVMTLSVPVGQKKQKQKQKATLGGTRISKISKRNSLKGLLVLDGAKRRNDSESSRGKNAKSKFDADVIEEDLGMIPLVIGRNSKQNDRISFSIAKDHHIWFHVQGFPGSHCLLLTEPGQSVDEISLQLAADVAAFYSKARMSKNVPVGYCSPKYLKRAPGGKPGLVQVSQQDGVLYGDPARGEQFVEMFT